MAQPGGAWVIDGDGHVAYRFPLDPAAPPRRVG